MRIELNRDNFEESLAQVEYFLSSRYPRVCYVPQMLACEDRVDFHEERFEVTETFHEEEGLVSYIATPDEEQAVPLMEGFHIYMNSRTMVVVNPATEFVLATFLA